MSNAIEGIDVNKLLSMGNKSCNCEGSGSSNIGFEMAYNSLLSAFAKKEREGANVNLNLNVEDKLQEGLDSLTNNVTSNKVEITNKDEDVAKRIDSAVKKASIQYGVDENLIKAIIKVESNFNPNVVSSAGAKGLMQLMPFNCEDLGVTDPFNIEQNIDGGTRHIKEYLDMYDGNVEMALMAYNGGPTRMRQRGVKTPEDIYKMPKETQNYVPKVMKIYRGE